MTYILIGIIILQFGYTIYKDESFKKEREKLQLKLMSKDVIEYKDATEKEPKPEKEPEPDPFVPLEDVSVDKLMEAEDGL